MANSDTLSEEQNSTSSSWWSVRRTKLAGLCGLIGGIGGLLPLLAGLGIIVPQIGDTGVGISPSLIIILYPVWHLLMGLSVFGANGWYRSGYGRGGRILAVLLGLSLVGEAVSILVLMFGGTMLGELLVPIGVIHGTIWMAIRLFGTLYGIALWGHERVNVITAGLFVTLFPAIFILAPLTQIGFSGALIPAPLNLAVIALGYELLTIDSNTTGSNRSDANRNSK